MCSVIVYFSLEELKLKLGIAGNMCLTIDTVPLPVTVN